MGGKKRLKIWEVGPLECPKCGGEMSVRPDSGRIISFITEALVIRQILEHLNLWEQSVGPHL